MIKLAAKKVHPALITHGESLTLAVQDLGLIVQNALALYPQIAEKVPAQAQLVLGATETQPLGRNLLRVLHFGHNMQRRAIVWPTLGILLGALGLVLTRRKDLYLLRVGLGLTIVALLLAAIARFGGYVVAGLTRSPVLSDIITGSWLVFLAPLALRMLVLAALGVILVAAVTTLLEKIETASLARRLWGIATKRPANPAWIIVRGLAVATIAVIVMLYPVKVVAAGAVAIAALAFFIGIQDVFVTAARAARRSHLGKVVEKKRRSSAVPAFVGIGLVLILSVGAVLWLVRGPEPKAAAVGPTAILACNGYPELRDRRLNKVVFPTTHNSMASADISDWYMPNQEKGIRQQLEDGVRGLLIDVHYGEPVKGRIKTLIDDEANARVKYEEVVGKDGVDAAMRIRDRLVGNPEGPKDVYMAHGFCELGSTKFVTALEAIKEFLVLNPNEVLIIVIQDEGVTPADVALCFEKSGLLDFVYRGPVVAPWPTLGEMVARNERIVVMAENNAEGVPWYHHMIGILQETPYKFKTPEEFSNEPNRGGKDGVAAPDEQLHRIRSPGPNQGGAGERLRLPCETRARLHPRAWHGTQLDRGRLLQDRRPLQGVSHAQRHPGARRADD